MFAFFYVNTFFSSSISLQGRNFAVLLKIVNRKRRQIGKVQEMIGGMRNGVERERERKEHNVTHAMP